MFGGKNSINWKWEIDNNTFDLVNVSQFKNTHFSTILAFFLAIIQILLTIALYALDCYTCVKLLAYNQWASEIQPFISIKISRWIFSGCILLSLLLLIYEWIYGIRVYKTRNISLTYTNSVARFLWSCKGYSYFCLYDQITPKNFFDYCAFFIYFTFKGCIKLLLADSPRQVINGLTIYSVVKDHREQIVSAYESLSTNGVKDTWAIVFTIMGLSFIIWLIFILKFFFALLISACVVTKINQEGYVLKQFVCVRINERVRELSSKYHKESLKQLKEENSRLGLRPTLPILPDYDHDNDDNDYSYSGRPTGIQRGNSVSQKFSNLRRSLRKSGVDLLPLNKHPAPPPPLPAYSSNTLQQKQSMSNLNQKAPQDAMSPIYASNYGKFDKPQPARTLAHSNSNPSIRTTNTSNSFQSSNAASSRYAGAPPKGPYQNPHFYNQSDDFASSKDNLLASHTGSSYKQQQLQQQQTGPIQPPREMPRPHPLESSYTGSTYTTPGTINNNFRAPPSQTNYATSNFTGGTLVNNNTGNNNNIYNSSAPYPTDPSQMAGGGSVADLNQHHNQYNYQPQDTIKADMSTNYTDSSNLQPQYNNHQIVTESFDNIPIGSIHTATNNSTAIPPYPSNNPNSRNFSPDSVSNASFTPMMTSQSTSGSFTTSNNTSTTAPYPTTNPLSIIPETIGASSAAASTSYTSSASQAPYPTMRNPFDPSIMSNQPNSGRNSDDGSPTMTNVTTSSQMSPQNNNVNSNNLPYSNNVGTRPLRTSLRPEMAATARLNTSGAVDQNSRLLLINNLYGGEVDHGDTGVSPILPTYKDMGLEEYLGKKR